jgi:hypothetical protein
MLSQWENFSCLSFKPASPAMLPSILWLLPTLAAATGATGATCEAADSSLFQAAHPSVPKFVKAAADASNKVNFCLGNTGRCFDFPALHGITRAGRTVFHRCSEVSGDQNLC